VTVARVVIHHFRARRESEADAARFIRQVLREIQFQARLHVAFGPYTTGDLARSIEPHGPFFEFGRVSGSVGSTLPYASAVEGGAGLWGPRHSKYPIYPVNATHLKFYWRKVGRVVTLPYVNHPGQRGKGYLQKAAESVARRHNMLIIIREL
jgi:hypothetical protein